MNLTIRSMVWACLVILAIGACAKSGRDFDRTNVNNIETGVHDKAQVTAWLGTDMKRAKEDRAWK